MDKTELRFDPLTQEWTIFSEGRALPPAYGSVLNDVFDESPFTAGLERYAAHATHQESGEFGWQVRVVPNRLPILRVEGNHLQHGDGLYDHLDGVGAHEIVIEDPGTRSFEELPLADAARVVSAWRARVEDLRRDVRMRAFTVVKSTGRAAGQTVAHSLSQVFALAIVPPALRRKLEATRAYFAAKKRSLFADLIEQEQQATARLVFENPDFLVFCPYASRAPFEMAVWPKRAGADFHQLADGSLAPFAEALLSALRKLNRALDHPPYQLTLTTAPSRSVRTGYWGTLDEDFRWHATITPRLQPCGAFEAATGCHVNGVWPEVAADFLRQQEIRP